MIRSTFAACRIANPSLDKIALHLLTDLEHRLAAPLTQPSKLCIEIRSGLIQAITATDPTYKGLIVALIDRDCEDVDSQALVTLNIPKPPSPTKSYHSIFPIEPADAYTIASIGIPSPTQRAAAALAASRAPRKPTP